MSSARGPALHLCDAGMPRVLDATRNQSCRDTATQVGWVRGDMAYVAFGLGCGVDSPPSGPNDALWAIPYVSKCHRTATWAVQSSYGAMQGPEPAAGNQVPTLQDSCAATKLSQPEHRPSSQHGLPSQSPSPKTQKAALKSAAFKASNETDLT